MSARLRRGGVYLDARNAQVYLETMDERVEVATEIAFENMAAQAEARMRTGAPWTDRTGAARGSLSATPEQSGRLFTLILAHGVSYGIWLEVSNDGRYAIVRPTQEWVARQIPQVIAAAVNAALRAG